MTYQSVDAYIADLDGIAKERLLELRALVQRLLPGAEERISYNIPAYFVDGKMILYISAYKNHTSIYPGRTNSAAYNEVAAKYAYGKSTARFAHTEPLPTAIIEKFIKTRLKEVGVQ